MIEIYFLSYGAYYHDNFVLYNLHVNISNTLSPICYIQFHAIYMFSWSSPSSRPLFCYSKQDWLFSQPAEELWSWHPSPLLSFRNMVSYILSFPLSWCVPSIVWKTSSINSLRKFAQKATLLNGPHLPHFSLVVYQVSTNMWNLENGTDKPISRAGAETQM